MYVSTVYGVLLWSKQTNYIPAIVLSSDLEAIAFQLEMWHTALVCSQ